MTVVPSSNIKCAGVTRRAAWLSQISKKPTFIRINWSSWPKSQKPGTRLANSTTLWTLGVIHAANCCHNQTRWDSRDSAVELATFNIHKRLILMVFVFMERVLLLGHRPHSRNHHPRCTPHWAVVPKSSVQDSSYSPPCTHNSNDAPETQLI